MEEQEDKEKVDWSFAVVVFTTALCFFMITVFALMCIYRLT